MRWGERLNAAFADIKAHLHGARPYRYEGEADAHAAQRRETQQSLSLMANADLADPDQIRMASDIEHGAENRLTVLLGKARLSLEEKRERDTIQAGLQQRRQGFVVEPAQSVSAPRRFLGPLMAANPLAGVLMSPALWVAAAFAIPAAGAAIQTARLHHAKHDLDQARHDVATAAAIAHQWEERSEHYRQELIDAANVARQAAAALDAERAAQARAAARERRRNRELANVLAHSPDAPAWRLRDDEPAQDQPATPTP